MGIDYRRIVTDGLVGWDGDATIDGAETEYASHGYLSALVAAAAAVAAAVVWVRSLLTKGYTRVTMYTDGGTRRDMETDGGTRREMKTDGR